MRHGCLILTLILLSLSISSCKKTGEEDFQITVSPDTIDVIAADTYSCTSKLKSSTSKDITKYYARIPAFKVIWRNTARNLRIEGFELSISNNEYTGAINKTMDLEEITAWRGQLNADDVVTPTTEWPVENIPAATADQPKTYEFIQGKTVATNPDCAPIFGGLSVTSGKEKLDFTVSATLTLIGVSRSSDGTADDRIEYASTTINLHNRAKP